MDVSGSDCGNGIVGCASCKVTLVAGEDVKTCLACASGYSLNPTATKVKDQCVPAITFEDPSFVGNFARIPNGYQGFDWSEVGHINPAYIFGPNGYAASVVSPVRSAFTYAANPAKFTSSTGKFTVSSLYATAAWRTGVQTTFEGYFQGKLVGSYILSLSPVRTRLDFQNTFKDIDEFRFKGVGGIPLPGANGVGSHIAIDDVVVTRK